MLSIAGGFLLAYVVYLGSVVVLSFLKELIF